jgi:hypothetical protein
VFAQDSTGDILPQGYLYVKGRNGISWGSEFAELGRSSAAPVHEVRGGCAEGKGFDEVEAVKAAPEGAALHIDREASLGLGGKTRGAGGVLRSSGFSTSPAPTTEAEALPQGTQRARRSEEIEGVHVYEDGGLGDFVCVGVG